MKDKLDERQEFNKNKIGNQCFMLLSYLLLADLGLSGFGVHWLRYPFDIVALLFVCLFVYMIRQIATGSFSGPRAKKRTSFIVVAIAVAFAAACFILHARRSEILPGDNSGMTLFIISAVLLVIVLVVTLIRKKQDHSDE